MESFPQLLVRSMERNIYRWKGHCYHRTVLHHYDFQQLLKVVLGLGLLREAKLADIHHSTWYASDGVAQLHQDLDAGGNGAKDSNNCCDKSWVVEETAQRWMVATADGMAHSRKVQLHFRHRNEDTFVDGSSY